MRHNVAAAAGSWKNIHPSIVTLPMEWEYTMPLGVIYAKEPSQTVQDFIADIRAITTKGFAVSH